MSRLDELIAELCPDGVQYKLLSEIATITRGGSLQKKDFTDSGVPCIHYGQIYTKYGLFTDKTFTFVSEATAQRQRKAVTGDIIMAVTSENIDDVCKCVVWLGEEPVAVSGHTAIIHHDQNSKYLAFYFQSSMFSVQKAKLAHGTKVIEVTPDKLNGVKVPVPPMEVQREIVRILDNFTLLTAELTAELTARQKQYKHYIENLLSFDSTIATKKLGEIASFSQGIQVPVDKQYEEKGQDMIRFLRIVDYVKENERPRYIKKPDIKYTKTEEELIMIRYGADSAGRVFTGKTGAIANNMFKINIQSDEVNPVFLRYYLSLPKIYDYLHNSTKSTMPSVNFSTVEKVEIPLPPLKEQARIVSIINKFEHLCNDITCGIPAEIAARQKQYEYYRDKLLSFNDKEKKEDKNNEQYEKL